MFVLARNTMVLLYVLAIRMNGFVYVKTYVNQLKNTNTTRRAGGGEMDPYYVPDQGLEPPDFEPCPECGGECPDAIRWDDLDYVCDELKQKLGWDILAV